MTKKFWQDKGYFFLASSDFCHLLITFENSLDLDQDRHSVSPDLNLKSLTLIVFLKGFFFLNIFKKSQQMTKVKMI